MYCSRCGIQSEDDGSFCRQCGSPMGVSQATRTELASLSRRVGSFVIDAILGSIPYLGIVVVIINWVMHRRGNTIGLRLLGARIIRENGDVSGFFHTTVGQAAGVLSLIPLGLGYWWAIWDPQRQTRHDKLMHTYVMRDSGELGIRRGTSSGAAVIWFWVLLAGYIIIPFIGILFFTLALSSFPGGNPAPGGEGIRRWGTWVRPFP